MREEGQSEVGGTRGGPRGRQGSPESEPGAHRRPRPLAALGASPGSVEALGARGAARARGAGDRGSRGPARGGRPPFRRPGGWLLLACWLWLPARCPGRSPGAGELRCLQMSAFANRSWARSDGLALVGGLRAYRWGGASDAVSFLKPWARGSWGQRQWDDLQHLFRVYRRSFTRDVQEFVKMLRLDYPFEIQVSAGCEVLPGNTSQSFFQAAFQGQEILRFQGTSWVPAPSAPVWADRASRKLNEDQGTRKTLQLLLNDTCPLFVRDILEAGKSELEKQVKPEAWLSTGPSPGPGRLLLVCHVSGFYPKPVWVTWMRGEQEQPGTRRGDVLPHADETWYLRVTLDVAAGEAAGLSCRVRHSSLGGRDMVLHWGSPTGLIAVAVLVSLVITGCVGYLTLKRRCSYQNIL
ncbi:antigen-presenting glycoprotein CD1d-like [Prionailurus bengalensis]|uniref:antigen-presenting glycoprotein CD1d-like n=1 Tax=Prionailurus bengalensis TaxID=37029 RepID=UPI001CA962D4|nr:antigen-presenting glycoprotein CD1d-like [Prionailurus bengalensis]